MAETYGKGTEGQKPSGGGGSRDALAELQKQLDALGNQIKSAQEQIDAGNQDVKSKQADVQSKQDQLKALQAQQKSLQQLVDGYKKDQQTVSQQRQSAQADAAAARKALTDICTALEDELSQDYRDELDKAVKDVDDQIAYLTKVRDDKQAAAKAADDDLAQKQAAQAQAQTTVTQAQNDVRGLPGKIQAADAQVKKLQAALDTAYTRGPAKEAYLLAAELQAALVELEKLLDPAYEQALAQKLQDGWTAYQAAAGAVGPAEDAQKKAKSELEGAQAKLKNWTDNRRKFIDKALESTSGNGAAAPAGKPAHVATTA